jgi:hypothetical protein
MNLAETHRKKSIERRDSAVSNADTATSTVLIWNGSEMIAVKLANPPCKLFFYALPLSLHLCTTRRANRRRQAIGIEAEVSLASPYPLFAPITHDDHHEQTHCEHSP